MGFVLSLTAEETAALRDQAAREHRSMHEVARLAVRERIGASERMEWVRTLAADARQRHAELLQELAGR
jgi:hypothetical protein